MLLQLQRDQIHHVFTGQNEIDDVHDALITRQSYIERHWTCPIKIFVLHSKVGCLTLFKVSVSQAC